MSAGFEECQVHVPHRAQTLFPPTSSSLSICHAMLNRHGYRPPAATYILSDLSPITSHRSASTRLESLARHDVCGSAKVPPRPTAWRR